MNLLDYFNALAPQRERWLARNRAYHRQLARAFRFFIPPDRAVLEIGCGLGQLLAAVQPRRGVGVDLSPEMVRHARQAHPEFTFAVADIEDPHWPAAISSGGAPQRAASGTVTSPPPEGCPVPSSARGGEGGTLACGPRPGDQPSPSARAYDGAGVHPSGGGDARSTAGLPFDYIIVSDLLGFLHDVQQSFTNLHAVCHPQTRLIVSYYNYLWEPVLRLGERLGLKPRQPLQNWLGTADIENLLDLAGFEVIRQTTRLLLPQYVPLLSAFCNRVLVHLPLFRHLALVQIVIARPVRRGEMVKMRSGEKDRQTSPAATPSSVPLQPFDPSTLSPLLPSVSVIIPARNERGNIAAAVQRTPALGRHTEIIFVEGNSTDGTADEIRRVIAAQPDRDLKLVPQGDGRGKADAVRKGFAAATGDVLMILDADLTVAPEELTKFYDALVRGHGEFIHGSRLVYPMEQQAMRFLNVLGNKFFSLAFTYLLDQRFKDTLCGTKVLSRADYHRIADGRAYFGEFDPFGDFDLLFGAAKLNLKIVELPIHYRERTYGTTNISRFRHGWLLLRMCLFAMRKIKFV